MKLAIVTIFLLSISICKSEQSELVGFRSSTFKGTIYSFKITKSSLDKTQWKESDTFPPLSPRAAYQTALKQAKQLRPEVTNWNVASVALTTPLIPSDEHRKYNGGWIYLVKLQDFSGPIFGTPYSLEIPVYLDGSVINPEIKKWPAHKAEQGAAANP